MEGLPMNPDNRSITLAAECYGAARVSKRHALLFLVCVAAAQAAPQRIVSTAPGITEILFALGVGNRVVGVTEYCVYPPEVKKLPKIGSFVSPSMEVIVSLRPDIIFVQRTAIQDAAKFVPLRLQTAEVELERIPDIYAAIQTIGNAAGVPDKARTLVQNIQKQLAEIRKRVEGRPKTPAMFIVGRIPGKLEGIIAAGGKSYISEMIEVAGGRNIFADSRVSYPKVLHEELLARNPQVIIDMGEHADASSLSAAQIASETALYNRYPSIAAVKDKRVHIVSSSAYVVPGPRVVECARRIAGFLHPEAFR
jgi:iron complex transport system substrate-binding protein